LEASGFNTDDNDDDYNNNDDGNDGQQNGWTTKSDEFQKHLKVLIVMECQVVLYSKMASQVTQRPTFQSQVTSSYLTDKCP